MNNLNLVRGIFLVGIALLFGLASFKYDIGQLRSTGPGLFPLIVSSLLLLIGVLSIVKSFYMERVAIDYRIKNIVVVLLALIGFAVLSAHVNMTLGIIFLVFCSSFAASTYSILRNVKISAGLIVIALVFKHLLGLGLPLF
ncbi:tripartite tricarboxylate transporter TctB family protein [Noviherbaspirillum galbum]|uniref:tripartite tricarboxylate transporter TctB family protein n=1 Tax=Noviherbaspirillum galbum TaxID=2709383 RepID=UPI0013D288E9|nr:tripartite tricarboxylate transporter TctB family protein [Noviherbaspirillum galbum]